MIYHSGKHAHLQKSLEDTEGITLYLKKTKKLVFVLDSIECRLKNVCKSFHSDLFTWECVTLFICCAVLCRNVKSILCFDNEIKFSLFFCFLHNILSLPAAVGSVLLLFLLRAVDFVSCRGVFTSDFFLLDPTSLGPPVFSFFGVLATVSCFAALFFVVLAERLLAT